MYTLLDVKSNFKFKTNIVVTINALSIDDALLKFMAKLFESSTCKNIIATITISTPNNARHTKNVIRKLLSIPINDYKYIHYVEK